MSWKFYGRKSNLQNLTDIMLSKKFIFLKIEGRRRIGKTRLIQEALAKLGRSQKVFYFQVPDAEPGGLVSQFRDAVREQCENVFGADGSPMRSLSDVAKALNLMLKNGFLVILDEFQYLNHAKLRPLLSYLQRIVDEHQRFIAEANNEAFGLIVLGSLHTEMEAILSDKTAPLYGRVSHVMDVSHLSIATIRTLLNDQGAVSPFDLLFYYNLFEGVPKYYQNVWDQKLFGLDHEVVIKGMFFDSNAPLNQEAENWFLHGLKGRSLAILNAIAHLGGFPTHKELLTYMTQTAEGKKEDNQIGVYLETLKTKFKIIQIESPIFTLKKSRHSRYCLADNFLQVWLGVLRAKVQAIPFQSSEALARRAREQLLVFEGKTFERMMANLAMARSKHGVGDFQLEEPIRGYWNEKDFEIDLILLNHSDKRIRLGSCKRSVEKLKGEGSSLEMKAKQLFMRKPFSEYRNYELDFVLCAPQIEAHHQHWLNQDMPQNCQAVSLHEWLEGLPED